MAAQLSPTTSVPMKNMSYVGNGNNEHKTTSNDVIITRQTEVIHDEQYVNHDETRSVEFEETVEVSTKDEVSIVLSVLYGIMVVILAIVFKVAEYITDDAQLASKEYQCVLFSIAILWLVAFKVYSMWHRHVKGRSKFSRSPHASNRWLKGVIVVFGFAIVVKDSLEVIGAAEIINTACKYRVLYFFKFILHAFFVLGQVVFLFFYSKIHIHEFQVCSRFGVMHAMATNLAVWIGVIADETSHAIKIEITHDSPRVHPFINNLYKSNASVFIDSIAHLCENTSQLSALLQMDADGNAEAALPSRALFSGACTCQTPVCHVISRAEAFLSPLLIEFCLVSSCLLYCVWNHIGKETIHHKEVAKPSHKFYKSYKGVMLGGLVLVATVIVITLLGTLDSGTAPALKSYYTEIQYLLCHEIFLLSCDITILLACGLAFYIYSITFVKQSNASVNLDSVLLFICLVGPLMVGLFSILSLSAGSSTSKGHSWVTSLVYYIIDVIASIVQVQLIVYGLHRGKVIDDELMPYNDQPYVRTNPNRDRSLTMYPVQANDADNNQMTETSFSVNNDAKRASNGIHSESVVEEVIQNEEPADVHLKQQTTLEKSQNSQAMCGSCSRYGRRKTLLPPNQLRLVLRETIMFLVLSNTCLWIFLSLNGTLFKIYGYQAEYFGHSAWTTLVSVTAPLSIFLKLHFAACYFEIWSYS